MNKLRHTGPFEIPEATPLPRTKNALERGANVQCSYVLSSLHVNLSSQQHSEPHVTDKETEVQGD